MIEEVLFQTKDMGNGIIRIEDASNVFMYLVKGSTHAALIDTGTGIGNLKEFVSSLTDLPVFTLNTHGHVDHAGGNYDFDEIYITETDTKLLKKTTKVDYRIAFAIKSAEMAANMQQSVPKWKMEDFTAPRELVYHFIKEGDTFELGGRTLTVVEMTGHTQGSVGFIDSQTGIFFAGDCGNPSTFLFFEESSTIERYLKSLQHFKECFADKVTVWYISHVFTEQDVTCLEELIDCCEKILEKKETGQQFLFNFADLANPNAFFAYPAGKDQMRTDGKLGNIVFDCTRRR